MTANPATLEAIAREARVSRMTVSNVLNGYYKPTQRKALERAERIRQIARKLGYMPNAAAKAIRAGRFGAVALLLSTKERRSVLPDDLLAGVLNALTEKKQRLEVARLPDEKLTSDEQMPQLLRELSVDGLLIDYTHSIPDRMVQIIREHRLPAIWINSKQEADCVHPDDLAAVHQATQHLLSKGHRRIGYVDYSQGPGFIDPHYSAADRRRGYERAMRDAQLPSRVYMAESGDSVPGPERVPHALAMLSDPARPTAIVTYGRTEAEPIIVAAVHLGLRIPADLSLINVGEYSISYLGPRLATMLSPNFEVGGEAVAMLNRKMDHPSESIGPIAVAFSFDPGDSVGPCPNSNE